MLEFKIEYISTINADPVRFKQIIYNLLSNAIKFTPEGGTVNVNAGLVDEKVQISVQDTGIGIAREHYEKVFEEFEQIDSAYARQCAGTGLGLPLTKKLIELHGGKIWLESEPGKGSTFTFTIPRQPKMEKESRGYECPL
ncbi:MAG: ATP-binding protein [bacterium]|nr:ATP-binding protein [bacterium]